MKKKYLLTVFCLAATIISYSQESKKAAPGPSAKNKQRPEDKIRQYFFVMLTKGENRARDSAAAAKLQAGHMANINKLYYEGKLKVAGPFGDDGNWRGIFIFDCASKEEVEVLLKTDPAIAAGSLAYEIHPWWTASMGSFKPGIPKKN
ncbi:MAG: YciI family protein [Bacteroidota bacterium]